LLIHSAPTLGADRALVSGQPIPVGGDGLGPISRGIQNRSIGSAVLSNPGHADLFVAGHEFNGPEKLDLLRWVAGGPDGAPVFQQLRTVRPPQGVKQISLGSIYQTPDKAVHGVWVMDGSVIRSKLDEAGKQFVADGSPSELTGLPRKPMCVAVIPSASGNPALVIGLDDGTELRPGDLKDWRDPKWVAYNGAGIWRGGMPGTMLYAGELTSETGNAIAMKLVTGERETLLRMGSVTWVNLGPGHERDIITGSHYGNFNYYRNSDSTKLSLESKRLATDANGIALRHPTISSNPVAYLNAKTGMSDLIAGGEGDLWYYSFLNRFAPTGAPMFADPVQALEKDALLYVGSLPVANVADWDGDGAKDLIIGNSTGMILFCKNVGTNESPSFARGVPIEAGGKRIHVQPGYWDVQGPAEARWGYISPTVFDWDGDGLPDIVSSDSTARHNVYLNRGTKTAPKLDAAHVLYCDGLEMHGSWRVRPGVGKLGDRTAYVALDDQDHFHLWWRIDDYNLQDAGKLTLDDGSPIGANFLSAGGTGRSKIALADWDMDGKVDLVVGTPRHGSIPNPKTGLPQSFGLKGSAVVFLKNVGTNEQPKYAFPTMMKFKGEPIYLGQHECGPAVADFGNKQGPDLIVGRENGRVYYFSRADLTWGPDQR
jgi:hypothetical protein